MSLAERLSQRQLAAPAERARPAPTAVAKLSGALTDIRRRVHRELQDILGQQLYMERSMEVLEQRVRETLQDVLDKDESHLGPARPDRHR